jgi:RNA polymerase sigma-70 factor (ECF subfamily)
MDGEHVKDADRQLVEAIRAGDAQAFARLYSENVGRVHAYAYAKLGSRAEADDVAQDVFEAVHHGIASFEGRSDLVIWIYGITRNLIHNRIRRRTTVRWVPLEEGEDQPTLDHESPEGRALARESLERMQDAIESLAPDQRQILQLRHEQRLAIRRIAEIMERSEDAVKSSLYRTRKALAQRFPDALESS